MKLDVRWPAATLLAFAALGAAMWVVVSHEDEPVPLAAEPSARGPAASDEVSSGPAPLAQERETSVGAGAEEGRVEVVDAPLRATVVLQGQLLRARGLGRELTVRVAAQLELESWEFDTEFDEQLDPVLAAHFAGTPGDDESAGQAAEVDADGHFELDVTPLLGATGNLPTRLVVSSAHRNFRTVRAEVPLTLRGRPLTRADLARDERIELPFVAQLEPVCILAGAIDLSDGDGRVHVEAWRLSGRRPAQLLAEADVATPDGRFELACSPCPELAVVAFRDGFLPQTRVVYLADELELWLGRLTLDRGFEYSGQVAVGEHTLGASAWLYLSRENPVFNPERFHWRGFVWFDNRFEPEAQAVRTASDGSFRFTGLAGGLYELRMGIDPKWWTQMDPVYFVRAPAEGVTLRPWLTRIELQLEQGDEPAGERPIAVRGLGRDGASTARLVTDGIGRAQLRLFPGEPYVVAVEQPRGPAWEYGKVTSRERLDAIERISMAAHPAR